MERKIQCSTPGCSGQSFKEFENEIFCNRCRRVTCISCNANHENKTCEYYQRLKEKRSRNVPTPSSRSALNNTVPVARNCKAEGCNSGTLIQGVKGGRLFCIVCRKYTCIVCDVAHGEETCEEYQYRKQSPAPPTPTRRLRRSSSLELVSRGMKVQKCHTSGCHGKQVIKGDEDSWKCSVCGKVMCIPCDAFHPGMSCDMYKHKVKRSQRARDNAKGISSPKAPMESLTQVQNCSTPGCHGEHMIEDGEKSWICDKCFKLMCVSCGASHEKTTCEIYKLRKETKEKHSKLEKGQLTDKHDTIVRKCGTEGCNGSFFGSSSQKEWQCDKCLHWMCVPCKASHEGQSCENYQYNLARRSSRNKGATALISQELMRICGVPGCTGRGLLNRDLPFFSCDKCGSQTDVQTGKVRDVAASPGYNTKDGQKPFQTFQDRDGGRQNLVVIKCANLGCGFRSTLPKNTENFTCPKCYRTTCIKCWKVLERCSCDYSESQRKANGPRDENSEPSAPSFTNQEVLSQNLFHKYPTCMNVACQNTSGIYPVNGKALCPRCLQITCLKCKCTHKSTDPCRVSQDNRTNRSAVDALFPQDTAPGKNEMVSESLSLERKYLRTTTSPSSDASENRSSGNPTERSNGEEAAPCVYCNTVHQKEVCDILSAYQNFKGTNDMEKLDGNEREIEENKTNAAVENAGKEHAPKIDNGNTRYSESLEGKYSGDKYPSSPQILPEKKSERKIAANRMWNKENKNVSASAVPVESEDGDRRQVKSNKDSSKKSVPESNTLSTNSRTYKCAKTDCGSPIIPRTRSFVVYCETCTTPTCIVCSKIWRRGHLCRTDDEKEDINDRHVIPDLNKEDDFKPQEILEASFDIDGIENSFRCKTESCSGWCIKEDGVDLFTCPVCKKVNCLICEVVHEGLTCKDYQMRSKTGRVPRSETTKRKQQGSDTTSKSSQSSQSSRKTVTPQSKNVPQEKNQEIGHKFSSEKKLPRDSASTPPEAESRMQNLGNAYACPLCNEVAELQEAIILKTCYHRICRNCFCKLVKPAETPVLCPLGEPKCNKIFDRQQISNVVGLKEYQEQMPNENGSELFLELRCLDPKCDGFGSKENKTSSFFICSTCNQENCTDCKAIHTGRTCKQYIEDVVQKIDRGQNEPPEEKMKRFQEYQSLYELELVHNSHPFECKICYIYAEPGDGVILKNCHHQFCRECLIEHIRASETVQVRCPFADEEIKCSMEILDDEIRKLLPQEEYEKWLSHGLLEAERRIENSYHCKTMNCKGWWMYDEKINTVNCPCCKKENCLRCEAIHEGKSCKLYQMELKCQMENGDISARQSELYLQEMLEQGQAMQCPKCSVFIFKRSGCDAITCASCQLEICWATKGPRWGPRGHGDISGGCRCRMNNRMCTPQCMNCH